MTNKQSDEERKKRRAEFQQKKRNKKQGKVGPIPWVKFEKFLFKVGCEFVEQDRSSHRKYRKAGLLRPVIVPVHTKELAPFYILNNLKTLGIGRQEYLQILEEL